MKYVTILLVVVGIVASVLIYSSGVTQRQNDRFAREDATRSALEMRVNACEREARAVYSSDWEADCQSLGLGENCRLPMANVNRWDNLLKEHLSRCK